MCCIERRLLKIWPEGWSKGVQPYGWSLCLHESLRGHNCISFSLMSILQETCSIVSLIAGGAFRGVSYSVWIRCRQGGGDEGGVWVKINLFSLYSLLFSLILSLMFPCAPLFCSHCVPPFPLPCLYSLCTSAQLGVPLLEYREEKECTIACMHGRKN